MSDGFCHQCEGHDERIIVAAGKDWCRECAGNEIERLQGYSNIDTVYQKNRALEAEIEKLKGRVVRMFERNEDLRAQVEELEKPVIFTVSRHQLLGKDVIQVETGKAVTPWVPDDHHITDEQINAAVKIANELEEEDCCIDGWFILNELHIFKCESPGCFSGFYTEGSDDGSQVVTRPCEVCNGHGWVIREVGDD
jgi:DnaJ-class molecular chaperone